MADFDVWINNTGKWIARLRCNVSDNSAGGYSDINWELILVHQRLYVGARTHYVWIDGTQYSVSCGAINDSTSAAHSRTLGSGSHRIYHTDGRNISVSAQLNLNAKISGVYKGSFSPSGSVWIAQLAVNPTLPTWINVSGGAGGTWVNKDNPTFNVSWGGASSGTYYISEYSIDVAKYGQNNWGNSGSVGVSNATGGSASRNIGSVFSVNGGDKVQVRVGMKTNNGTWWGHIYWNGVLNVYSSPTAPSTFTSPTSVEIDTGFNLTWGGASAGSNGIAGYDLEARAYNGSSWTGWTRILNCKNQSSYSVSKIKDLTVNGISYSTNGENVKFQYRIRTSDGTVGVSSWKNSNTISILINSPTTPRKSCHYRSNK